MAQLFQQSGHCSDTYELTLQRPSIQMGSELSSVSSTFPLFSFIPFSIATHKKLLQIGAQAPEFTLFSTQLIVFLQSSLNCRHLATDSFFLCRGSEL